MNRGWLVALVIIFIGIILVIIGIKLYNRYNFPLKGTPKTQKIPSMLRSLPFQEKPIRKPSLLVSSLRDNQLLLTDILVTPKDAPKGTYLRLSLVLDFASKETAQNYRPQKARLESIISDTIQRISYRDLISSEGPRIVKEVLDLELKNLYKGKIKKIWITTYEFQSLRGL